MMWKLWEAYQASEDIRLVVNVLSAFVAVLILAGH